MNEERRDWSQLMDLFGKQLGKHEENFLCMIKTHAENEEKTFKAFSDEIKKLQITIYGNDSDETPGVKLKVDRIDKRLENIESSVSRWKNYTTGALIAGLSGWAHKIGASLFK